MLVPTLVATLAPVLPAVPPAVLESAGVRDVLSKSLGSNNPTNVAKAALQALRQLRRREEVMALRDKN